MPRSGNFLYGCISLGYIRVVEKKYSHSSDKDAATVKEPSPAPLAEDVPRIADHDLMQKAIAHAMKIHGTALQKLAK